MDTAGALYHFGEIKFKVWAPEKETMLLHIIEPEEHVFQMVKDGNGYFTKTLASVTPATRYFFMPNGDRDYPDPASRYQPEGVHGPSQVIDHDTFLWQDENWSGFLSTDLVIYEVHVGTFSQEGTFEAIIPRLDDLKTLGITAIQLMPITQFPGARNWGYDGVYPYAVQNSYGGPSGLKQLVNQCHLKGIAVILDVVYNHLGPEGNYLKEYGPYFTDKYKTPWGEAINLDGEWSDGVRDYFLGNIFEWFTYYHIDGLRVDAIHAMFDNGSVNFWEVAHYKIKNLQQQLGRPLHMIAESDYNNPRVIKAPETGGLGFDAQWLDDFHHALYALLFQDGKKVYEDFGTLEQLAKAYKEGFVHCGEFVKARKKKFGLSSAGIAGNKFVVYNQNHDQIGNKGMGERSSVLLDFKQLKLAAAATILSPYIPMLFMGEEYAEENPFQYFIHHSDEKLIQAVKTGRGKDFSQFLDENDLPDPQDDRLFEQSKLKWDSRKIGKHKEMLDWYQKLLYLRQNMPAFKVFNKDTLQINYLHDKLLILHRSSEDRMEHLFCVFNFSKNEFFYSLPSICEQWQDILSDEEYVYKAETNIPCESWDVCLFKGVNH